MSKKCVQSTDKPVSRQWKFVHRSASYAQLGRLLPVPSVYNSGLSSALYLGVEPVLYTQCVQQLSLLINQLYSLSTPPITSTTKYNKK
jgi:hypothetical protein